MKDLIERLEKATGPDRELDMAIGEKVGDWGRFYTNSIDAALTLLPDDNHHWSAGYSRHVAHNAEVRDLMHPHKGVFVGECDSTRAIALCIAALRARESQP